LRYIILDVRSAAEFGTGHVPGSLNIGLGGQFAMWAGSLIPLTAPIVIVAQSEAQVDEAQMRLARVGIENVKGYLEGGVEVWRHAGFDLATVQQISVDELNRLIVEQTPLQILDVRRPPEYASGHVPRAIHAPLSTLAATIQTPLLNPAKRTAVICAGGFRSSAATSILQQNGFADLLNVTGGTTAWLNAGYPVEVPPGS
jgi:rhodanese-related sulfurtransferase